MRREAKRGYGVIRPWRKAWREEFDGKLVARRGRARPIAYDKWPSMSAHPAPRERRLIDTSFA